MANPTVHAIVEEYLRQHGFDGLWNNDGECACKISALAPCSEMGAECTAGYLAPCPENCGEHYFHITARKHTEDDHG